MFKKLKLGLAGFLVGATALAGSWMITGNRPDNLTSEEYMDLVNNISTNTLEDTGLVESHSRYWGTNGLANGWVSIYNGTNLESTVQADANGNWFSDIYSTNGSILNIIYNDGTNAYDGGIINHVSGGFPQVTNHIGEAIATTNQYSLSIDKDFNLNWAPTVSGGVYEVWSTSDLTQGFTNLESTITSLTENCSYSITNHANKSKGFYRIKTNN